MAKRLNKKVAIIGSLFLTIVLIGAIFLLLKYSKDPYDNISDAQELLAKVSSEVEAAIEANDYSDARKESIKEQYSLVNESYSKAYGYARDIDLKIEILYSLADIYKIDNPYHPKSWKGLRSCWNSMINVSPKHIDAHMNLLKYYYEAGDSSSQGGRGAASPVWRTVETTATDIINILKDADMAEDLFVLKAKAHATLEIVVSGQTTNAEKSINDTIDELNHLKQLSPSDADIYLYLARAHGELGKLLAARAVSNAVNNADDTIYAILTEGQGLAKDKAKIEIALLNSRAAQARSITEKSDRRQKMDQLRADYEELASRNKTNPEVHASLALFYTMDNSLANAIGPAQRAIELDDTNVQYALLASTLYYNDFSNNKKVESLTTAIKLANKASKLPDAQLNRRGPRQQLSRVNYYSLLSLRAKLQIERAIWANEKDNEEENESAVSQAELLIHDIKQLLTENKIIFAKWDGLLAIAKSDYETAIRELFTCQAELKTTGDVDTLVSYYLSRILAGAPEIGARAEFLTDALFTRHENFVSIAVTKPDALLDLAEILLRLQQPTEALPAIDFFEKRVGSTKRSKEIKILAYIRNGQLDDAKVVLSELDPQSPETVSLKIVLLSREISQLSSALESKGPSSLQHKSPDGEAYSRFELEKYRKERAELMKKMLKLKPEQVSPPIGVCRDLLLSGDQEAAKSLIDAFLKEHPEDISAKLFRKILAEPDPLNTSEERIQEVQISLLNEISDDLERHVSMGLYYNETGKQDLSEAELEKALEIEPDNKKAVSTLFDISIEKKDLSKAAQMAETAKQNNLDGCNGEFFAARLDLANGSLQNALTRYDACLELRPMLIYAYMFKSKIYIDLGEFNSAVDMALTATTMNPLNGQLARQAVAAIQARNVELGMNTSLLQRKELKDALTRAIALNPADWKLQVGYSKLIMDKEPKNAIAVMQVVAKNVPGLETSMLLGALAMELAEKEIDKELKAFYLGAAGEAYESTYASNSSDEKLINAYAEYLRVAGRHEDAKKILGDRKDVMWQFHIRDSQFEKAKDILLGLYKANPKDKDILTGLTRVSLFLMDTDGLKQYSSELLAVDDSIDNKLLQIHYFLEAKLYEEAEPKLISFRQQHKDEPRGLMLEAWIKMSKAEIDEALVLINETLAASPENAIAWRLSGQINMLSGDIEKAIRDLQKSKSIDLTSEVQLELANAHRQSGNMNEAIGVLVQAVEDDRASLNLWATLEKYYIEMGRRSDLGQFYSKVLRKYPKNTYWLFRSGVFSLQDSQFSDAEKLFLRSWEISEESPHNMAALDGYLNSLRKLRRHEEVLKYAKKYIETESAPVAYLNMANSHLYGGDRQDAIDCYNNAIEKSNEDTDFTLKVLEEMSKALGPQDVTKWCIKRLKTKPDSLPANLMMVTIAHDNRDFDEALRYADISLALTEGQEQMHLEIMASKGQIFILDYLTMATKQSILEAIKIYEFILTKRPNNSGIMNNLAYLYVESDQKIKQAAEYAKRAHEMDPTNANTMDTYAYTLIKIGKYEEADLLLQEAIDILSRQNKPAGWEIYHHLAMAQEGLKQYDNATASYKLAIKKGDVARSISEKKKQILKDALTRITGN